MTAPAGLPRLDPNRPTAARIYDYLLGGTHHFAADRDAARDMIASFPPLPRVLTAGRAFARRATRFLAAEQGIGQFLDLGSGIPTVRNVHEIALDADPRARVAYVDIDPVAVAHSRSILRGTRQAGCIHGDLRDPDAVLAHPGVRSLIDTARPVAVILNAVLHFVSDDAEAAAIVARYLASVAPGSWLVIAHHTDDSDRPDEARARQIYTRSVQTLTPRSHAQISAYFAGLTVVEPGVVPTPQWRPEPGDQASQATEVPRYYGYAGVGRTG